MPNISSLPPGASLVDFFNAHEDMARVLLPLAEHVMRAPAALSPAERELIATFVSALNACEYCAWGHGATAAAMGQNPQIVEDLLADVDGAEVEPKLKPLFKLAKVLTQSPARVTGAYAQAIIEAGWPEDAVLCVVKIVAHFNMMNRLVEGLGLAASEAQAKRTAEALSRHGYTGWFEAPEEAAAKRKSG